MRYAIAYDITDDHRRNQVYKFLKGWGRRVQKSVFECDLSPKELEEVVEGLKGLLVLPEDRCHIYRICGECLSKKLVLGEEIEPEWSSTITV